MPNLDLIRALEAAVQATPDNLPLRQHLADMLLAEGQPAESITHYRRALDLAPTDGALKLRLAQAYAAAGKQDVALVVLEDLLRSPNPPLASLTLAARLYLFAGQPGDAATAYRRVLATDPSAADAELDSLLGEKAPEPKEGAADTSTVEGSGESNRATQAQPVHDETGNTGDPREREMVFVVGEDEPEAADLYDLERPRITFADVGGMDKLKEEIRMKIIYPLAHPDLFQAYGKSAGGGILMYGPPGCGKTFLARATAGEVKASFLSIGLHDVLDMYIGQSERNLHQIFQLARSKAPCVLFFDEVDALGANRADMRHNAMRQVINQMLAEMDGVEFSNEGVLILAATNTPWYVDAALRRPGRFDRVLFVPPPDQPAREAILRLMLSGKPAGALDVNRLARETKDFSGADLKGALDQAIESKLGEALRTGRPAPLSTQDVLNGIRKQRPTTLEWFETARNYAIYSNEGGFYDDVLDYLKLPKGRRV